MSLPAAEITRIDTAVDAKATKAGQTAHNDSVQAASRNLLNDTDFRTARDLPDTPQSREYSARMTEDLVKQNLLPAVSLTYVGDNFDKIDTGNEPGKPATLSLAEIKAARDAAKPGSIERELYNNVAEMMEREKIKEMTKDQIQDKLKEIDKNFQSQDKKNAVEAGEALMNNKQLFNNIAKNDDVITRQDLKDFLAKPGNTDPDTLRKLTWLEQNWDDPDVKALIGATKNGVGITEDSVRVGVPKLKEDIVVEPGKPVEYGKQPPARAWGADDRPRSSDPEDKPHDWYVSDGRGNTVAVDYDADGKPKYTVGTVDDRGNVHYTGWSYQKETGKYVLLDGKQILAEADAIDFEPSTGKITPRGLMPRPSQEERARQNGAY